ncbi:MAG TPA: multicopper oxidase family protein [Acidobacteriaceae bacterium]|nr:multicopper oxidase family protein [Acidobacteriaceae bacterium]
MLRYRGGASLLSAEDPPLSKATRLRATMRTLEINGKVASLMGLEQTGGKQGMSLVVNQPFDVLLENELPVPTAIHWHGLHPPNNQDGVPGLTQAAIAPKASYRYYFPPKPAGTHWMHSHLGLQEAFLLSAPLIVHDPSDKGVDEQEIVLFLGDFSFTPPTEIFAKLRKPAAKPMAMAMSKPDVNDVNYDAYLANDHTLADPEVVRVEKHGKVRLRIINGSSGTNFHINLGNLKGELIATDGMAVQPLTGSSFPLAIAQRIDVRLQLPQQGAFPILALREAGTAQTGIILATLGSPITKLPVRRAAPTGLLTLDMESRLRAADPLATKPVDRSFDLRLQGNMARYDWPINGVVFDTEKPRGQAAQVRVKKGQRVAVKFINDTMMSHPMHLHGHSFQVTEINGKPLNGALRDTILVPPKMHVTVAFDANNPGTWYLHCHILWHLAAGMATLVQYEG